MEQFGNFKRFLPKDFVKFIVASKRSVLVLGGSNSRFVHVKLLSFY